MILLALFCMLNSKTPKVSILVPVYGVENYIERCARSLFEQTYKDIEYIFVDDCSPDKSIEILNQVIDDYPRRKPHVRIIRHESNKGLAGARNTVVDSCQTEFLMHVDSDDWIDKDAVEKLLKLQDETSADIVVYDVKMHFPNKTVIRHKPLFRSPNDFTITLLHKKINGGVWGGLIRRTLYTDNNIRVEDGINMSEDFQVFPRLAFYAKKVATLNNVYYHYNFSNESSYTHNETINTCKQAWRSYEILEEFFLDKNPEYLVALKEGKKKALARQLMSGVRHVSGREIFSSVQKMLDGLRGVSNKCLKPQEKIALNINNYRLLQFYIILIELIKKIK